MEWEPLIELVRLGGPVMIALTVLVALIALGHRFIWLPSQKQARGIAEANANAAKSNAEAAKSHENAAKSNEEAARFNSLTSEANSRTASHLERLTEMVLDKAIKH